MIRRNRKSFRMKNESCEDPRELLLSLVDMGSIDCDEMLIACVSEMSDAECKRVLNSLSLPSNTEEVEEDEYEVEEPDVEPTDDVVLDDEEMEEEEPADELEDSEEDSGEVEAEIESRIRRLERISKRENKNRRVESRKRKFEGIDGLTPDIDEWFSENCDADSYRGDEDAWLEETQMTADGENEDAVDNCIEAMIDEYGYDQDGVERRRGMITKRLAGLARRAIRKFSTR